MSRYLGQFVVHVCMCICPSSLKPGTHGEISPSHHPTLRFGCTTTRSSKVHGLTWTWLPVVLSWESHNIVLETSSTGAWPWRWKNTLGPHWCSYHYPLWVPWLKWSHGVTFMIHDHVFCVFVSFKLNYCKCMHVIARCAVHFDFWFVKVPVWGFLPWDVCASYHTYRTNLKCHLRHKSGQRLVEMDGCNWRLKRSHWRRSDLGTCIYCGTDFETWIFII